MNISIKTEYRTFTCKIY